MYWRQGRYRVGVSPDSYLERLVIRGITAQVDTTEVLDIRTAASKRPPAGVVFTAYPARLMTTSPRLLHLRGHLEITRNLTSNIADLPNIEVKLSLHTEIALIGTARSAA